MVDRARVVYFDEWVHPIAGEMLEESARIETVRIDLQGSAEDISSVIARAHGMQALFRTAATRSGTGERWLANSDLLAQCNSMLAICSAGAGYDVIDVDACTARGIIVCNQSGAGREAVAEHVLGFMLTLSKKISIADRVIRRSNAWDRAAFTGNDLLGKTLGIVGFGQIGMRLAELCTPFKLKVLAYDPYLSAEECRIRGGEKAELEMLLASSDFVSLNGPLTKTTTGMFGAAQFAGMKRGAFFITTARGGMHDETALAAALASGHLGGAGIDVFAEEPPRSSHPLLAFDNVVATPHSAGITAETTRDIAMSTADQWEMIFAGAVPPRLINPTAWPAYSIRFEQTFGFAPRPLH
jgi:D-3-phosphoglycerate dehydrogenase / 2-oxoglutarate reductase